MRTHNFRGYSVLMTTFGLQSFIALFMLMQFHGEPAVRDSCVETETQVLTRYDNVFISLGESLDFVAGGKLRDGEWSLLNGTNIATYSAFYDGRYTAPLIRIIAVTPRIVKDPPISCHLLYKDANIRVTKAVVHVLPENHRRKYSAAYIYCYLPDKTVPVAVGLSVSNRTRASEDWIKVVSNKMNEKEQQTMGLCLPVLFEGSSPLNPVHLIELFEMSKILGVGHFTAYTGTMSDDVSKVINSYVESGHLTTLDFALRSSLVHKGLNASDGKAWDVWYGGQLACINDCLYRHMYKFKYIAFQDLDEFILPKLHANWVEMINFMENRSGKVEVNFHGNETLIDGRWIQLKLKSARNAAGFLFRNNFVYYDDKKTGESVNEPCKNLSRELLLLKTNFTTSGRYWKKRWRSKMIVKPERITTMGIHQTHQLFEGKYFEYDVPIDIGILHHLRTDSLRNVTLPLQNLVREPQNLQPSTPKHSIAWKSQLQKKSQISFKRIFCN